MNNCKDRNKYAITGCHHRTDLLGQMYRRFPISTENLPMTLSVRDLTEVLGVSRNTAYEQVRSGKIRSIRVGRQFRIPKEAVLDFLEGKVM